MGALYYTGGARGGKMAVHEASERLFNHIDRRHFIPGGRYLYAAGNDLHQVQNCLLLSVDDSREGWAGLAWKAGMSLMTGAGIGVYYGKVRPRGSVIKRTGGEATGPTPLAISINDQGRAYVQGGNRRSAIWGGQLWSHPDIFEWITAKDWPKYIREAKAAHIADPTNNPPVPADLDMTNISVCLDDDFFAAFEDPTFTNALGWDDRREQLAPDGGSWHDWAQRVYWTAVEHMVTKGEPGFSIDLGPQREEKLRNACTEIVSSDDSDICNLGGVVLPRFEDPQEFGRAVRDGVLFLTAGTLYSDVPYDRVAEIREKNRRLGLDVMGVHEFCLRHGAPYGSDDSFELLEPYMAEYDRALEYAWDWQDRLGVSRSVAATSGAPTGTRAILGETTTGWEPVSAAAYKRRVRQSSGTGERIESQYVVDPTVKRLVDQGHIDSHDFVEDAHSLSYDVERRFKMQAYAQSHTDQAISMTINLPYQMFNTNEQRDFGNLLYRYLPALRGITVYPDGAIPGQPITPVPLEEALGREGVIFEETEEKCASGACGI